MNDKLEYKTYIFKATGEFAGIEVDTFYYKIDGWTSEIPQLLPMTHNKEEYCKYLKERYSSFSTLIDWNDYELITIYLQK
jgi:hypothetical protein